MIINDSNQHEFIQRAHHEPNFRQWGLDSQVFRFLINLSFFLSIQAILGTKFQSKEHNVELGILAKPAKIVELLMQGVLGMGTNRFVI